MRLSLFDLHCDTALELYRTRQNFSCNTLAVSLVDTAEYERYIQVMAHFTPKEYGNKEGWELLLAVHHALREDPTAKEGLVRLCPQTDLGDLSRPLLIPALEDARILDGHAERLSILYSLGFRIITPLWAGNSCIGGAHDTHNGLTAFGRDAVQKMLRLGIVPDVSHASEPSFWDILSETDAATLPPIASHSNAYALCPVSRNLRNEQIDALIKKGGLIGLNLTDTFLRYGGGASIEDAVRHVEYFLSRGAVASLALGCDFDGTTTPKELSSPSRLFSLAEALLRRNYSEETVKAIFFDNAYRFAEKYIQ